MPLLAVSLVATLLLGVGVVLVGRSGDAAPMPAAPLGDDEAAAQVVGAAAEIVAAGDLSQATAAYSFMSCVNGQDPPYQAALYLNFAVPQGNSVSYLRDVASVMSSRGWTESATAAEHFGHTLTRGGLTSTFHRNTEQRDFASLRLYGECRVVSDHRADDPVWTEVNDRLRR